jgi:hypothetical protein
MYWLNLVLLGIGPVVLIFLAIRQTRINREYEEDFIKMQEKQRKIIEDYDKKRNKLIYDLLNEIKKK